MPPFQVPVLDRNNTVILISITLILVVLCLAIIIVTIIIHYHCNVSRKNKKEDEYQLTQHDQLDQSDNESIDSIREDEYDITVDIEQTDQKDNTREDEQKANLTLMAEESDYEPGELLKVDEGMFNPNNKGSRRFVPTMIDRFEKIAAGIEVNNAEDIEDNTMEPGITRI